jgi:hypothetical protein
LSEPEVVEEESPLVRAMNNNIKLQVARQLDENTKLKMKDEFIRL